MTTSTSTVRTLLTAEQFVQRHSAFTLGGLRWWLFHRRANGLDQAVVRVGRRIYIDENKFFEWVDAQNVG